MHAIDGNSLPKIDQNGQLRQHSIVTSWKDYIQKFYAGDMQALISCLPRGGRSAAELS